MSSSESALISDYIEISSCPSCDCETLERFCDRTDAIAVLKCPACDLCCVEKYPRDLSKWYQDDYYKKDGDSCSPFGYADYSSITAYDFAWTAALIELTGAKNESIFDLGASDGTFLDLAKAIGFTKRDGIEYNDTFADLATKKGHHVASGSFIDFQETHKYDVITAWAVLEHLPEVNAPVAKIGQMLKEDGVVLLEVPTLVGIHEKDKGWLNSSLEHIFYFSGTALKELFERETGVRLFGDIFHYPTTGYAFVGFGTRDKAKFERFSFLEQAIRDPLQLDLTTIASEDLANLITFHFGYSRNWLAVKALASELNQRALLQAEYKKNALLISLIAERYSDIRPYCDGIDGPEGLRDQHKYLVERLQKKEIELATLRDEVNQFDKLDLDKLIKLKSSNLIGIVFGGKFCLQSIDIRRISDATVAVKLGWQALETLNLNWKVGFHITDEAGQILLNKDYLQDVRARSVATNELWVDMITFPAAVLTRNSQLGICLFEENDGLKLLEVDRGKRDYKNRRLLLAMT